MSEEGFVNRIARQVRWSIQRRGAIATLALIGKRLMQRRPTLALATHPFDLQHNVDTSGLISGWELATGHAHDLFSTAYFGVPPSRLRRAIDRWRSTMKIADLGGYAFVDIGCGKGRALLVASEFGFREVVGLEVSPELTQIAERNSYQWRAVRQDTSPIRVVCGDAATVVIPAGPVLLYLYNPFGAPVLRKLLEHLIETRGRCGPSLDLLYLHPEEQAVFREFPLFEYLWTEEITLSPDERLDEISSPEDPCSLYRLQSSGVMVERTRSKESAWTL